MNVAGPSGAQASTQAHEHYRVDNPDSEVLQFECDQKDWNLLKRLKEQDVFFLTNLNRSDQDFMTKRLGEDLVLQDSIRERDARLLGALLQYFSQNDPQVIENTERFLRGCIVYDRDEYNAAYIDSHLRSPLPSRHQDTSEASCSGQGCSSGFNPTADIILDMDRTDHIHPVRSVELDSSSSGSANSQKNVDGYRPIDSVDCRSGANGPGNLGSYRVSFFGRIRRKYEIFTRQARHKIQCEEQIQSLL